MTRKEIHRLVAELDYPMYIVTATDGTEHAGCLVGFATQCSVDPPRFLACISDKNHTFEVAAASDVLVVHLVPSDAEDLAELFGGETGDDVDKFTQCAWHEGPAGVPILDRCENWFAGRVLDRFDVGDHRAHLLEPIAAGTDGGERGFTFHRARTIAPGHAP